MQCAKFLTLKDGLKGFAQLAVFTKNEDIHWIV